MPTKNELEQENFELKAHIAELKNSVNKEAENEAQVPKVASTDYHKLIELSTQLNEIAVNLNHNSLKIANNPKSAGLIQLRKENKRFKVILTKVLAEIGKF